MWVSSPTGRINLDHVIRVTAFQTTGGYALTIMSVDGLSITPAGRWSSEELALEAFDEFILGRGTL